LPSVPAGRCDPLAKANEKFARVDNFMLLK
jgi:hypothetical protein